MIAYDPRSVTPYWHKRKPFFEQDLLFSGLKTAAHAGQKLSTATEQRRFRRYALHFPCAVNTRQKRKKSASQVFRVETKDVSKGGLYFVAEGYWDIGTVVECVIELPLQVFGGRRVGIRCRGKIIRVSPESENRLGVGATIQSFQYVHLEKDVFQESVKKGSSKGTAAS